MARPPKTSLKPERGKPKAKAVKKPPANKAMPKAKVSKKA
jgi:hypothetical protein